MRYGVIAVAVVSVLLGSTARDSYGDTAYGVGAFKGFDAFSGIAGLDTTNGTTKMLIPTPGLRWYGATDGPSADTFYAVANPWYDINPDPGSKLDPRSELFLINTTDWSVTSFGLINVPDGSPIREIALDNTSGILYGTDYANLYTIPTGGGGVTAAFVGPFGPRPDASGDPIDYVFSMDYDQNAGQLVGTSWRRGADETDLYYFNPATGAGTRVDYTGLQDISDVLYSHSDGKLLGVNRLPQPGQVFDVNTTTATATPLGTIPDVSFYGIANATPGPGSSEPEPFVTTPVPLDSVEYETYVFASVQTLVRISPGNEDLAITDPLPTDYGTNGAATLAPFDVPAQVPGAAPWQNTNAGVTIDLSSAASIPDGMLRVSSSMSAAATGSAEGLSGVTRHSSAFGNANIHGVIDVGIPDGGTYGMPLLFGAGVYIDGWLDGMHVLFGPGVYTEDGMQPTWDLVITDAENVGPGALHKTYSNQSDSWAFTFGVFAGQKLDYEFNLDGTVFEMPDGTFDLNADLDFGAAVPEPASMLLLCSAAIPLILKKRRHRRH